ncbi:MAG: hypothetical protein QXI91_01275 [Candidatus Bathyarchaeia archaeon]
MKLFSQRRGLEKERTEIQVESMDEALRNRLWNLLKIFYWDTMIGLTWISDSPPMEGFFTIIWHNYFKKPLDEMPRWWNDLYKWIRDYFFNCKWYEVYDFLELIVNYFSDEEQNEKFKKACNSILESELSAYRFVGNQITQITSKEEISEVEEALESQFKTVNTHLENALRLMSDRKSPDYRNSIKESISAVEAICRIITKDKNATLGKALDKIEKEGKIELHKALKEAFDHLYGYTSSAEGIRHSLLDEKITLSFEDAKFMLVSCSAFINYLISKVSKAKIEI